MSFRIPDVGYISLVLTILAGYSSLDSNYAVPGSLRHVCGGREVREVAQDTSHLDTVKIQRF